MHPTTALACMLLLALLHQLPSPAAPLPTSCQNGGTFDPVQYACLCTPQAYGPQCERLFSTDSPCQQNFSSGVQLIRDPTGAYRPGNTQLCDASSTCTIAFYSLLEGWYRFESPAGNHLVTSYPCRYGDSPGVDCGSQYPFTLRSLALELDDGNGTKLYSARAYLYDTTYPACYYPANLYYPVRVLMCPDNGTVYYMGPTSSSRHTYCIGDVSIGSTRSTTDGAALKVATTTSVTTGYGLATTGETTTNDKLTTATDSSLTTGIEKSAAVTTTMRPPASVSSQPAPASANGGWNLLANESHPCLPVGATDTGSVQQLLCSIRSNSMQAKLLRLTVAPAVVQPGGSAACCDFTAVLRWLNETGRIYTNCLMEVVNISGHSIASAEVTVCRESAAAAGGLVRCLTNRGQCVTEAADGSNRLTSGAAEPAYWYQWFGDGVGSARSGGSASVGASSLAAVAALVAAACGAVSASQFSGPI